MKRWTAISLALFVTFLWSTSYILNKWAFAEGVGPLTLAGLRYSLAAITLALARLLQRRPAAGSTPRLSLWHYAGLGLAGYLVAQGMQYVGQYYVTPTQSGMMLSVGNTSLVLLISILWLREMPTGRQWLGIGTALAGVSAYYWPFTFTGENLIGIGFLLISGLGYAVQLTANRRLLAREAASPLDLVLYPMIVGAVAMLALGLGLEGLPPFTWRLAGLLLWLGPVNGALAFFLWTYSQRELRAFESSTLNNTMLLQIAALDLLLLGRSLELRQLAALVLVGVGILSVQTARRQ